MVSIERPMPPSKFLIPGQWDDSVMSTRDRENAQPVDILLRCHHYILYLSAL